MSCETLLDDGCWVLDPPRKFQVVCKGPVTICIEGTLTAIRDDVLRPLRKHGDEAIDEMVQIAGKPWEKQKLIFPEGASHG